VLVSEFNSLGLYYYRVQPHRPAYVFLPDPKRRKSVEFYLSQRLMHLPELDPHDVVEFVHAHPGTATIMRSEYATVVPPVLQDLIAWAPFHENLAGNLTLACF